MNAVLPLAHLNLDVSDLSRSAEFYRSKLGLAVEESTASVTVRWPSFLLVLTHGATQASANFHFGFRVDSPAQVDAWIGRLRDEGVTVTAEPERRGATYVARIADPDAYTIEIFTFVS